MNDEYVVCFNTTKDMKLNNENSQYVEYDRLPINLKGDYTIYKKHNKEQILISKDKLVLISKLLKDLKNKYKTIEGKELIVYKHKQQRAIVEILFDTKAIDKFINNLKTKLNK